MLEAWKLAKRLSFACRSRSGATCSTSSRRARATCSTAGSSRRRSRRRSASMRSSATSRVPYTPGSAYVLLHHVFGEVNGKRGQWGHAIGGMGAITQAMAQECGARGVELRLGVGVERVIVERGRATGVALANGEIVAAKRVVANVNPKLLFERLVAARARRRRFPRAHRRLQVRLGHVPDERRAVRVARFPRAAGAQRAAAPFERHHRRAVARLHGARVLRRAHRRLVEARRSSRC